MKSASLDFFPNRRLLPIGCVVLLAALLINLMLTPLLASQHALPIGKILGLERSLLYKLSTFCWPLLNLLFNQFTNPSLSLTLFFELESFWISFNERFCDHFVLIQFSISGIILAATPIAAVPKVIETPITAAGGSRVKTRPATTATPNTTFDIFSRNSLLAASFTCATWTNFFDEILIVSIYIFGVIPAIILFASSLFLPESPRWMVLRGWNHKARKVLKSIRSTDDVAQELNENVHKLGSYEHFIFLVLLP